jgi:serine/threonine-protein phosphatase 2A activator
VNTEVLRMSPSGSNTKDILHPLTPTTPHEFIVPVKKIHEGQDLAFFLSSVSYSRITSFILRLNATLYPQKIRDGARIKTQIWELESPDVHFSTAVTTLVALITALDSIIDEIPLDTGPRRFGNVAFRLWYEEVEKRLPKLLDEYLPQEVLEFPSRNEDGPGAKDELQSILLGSFGSAQRLDYGTGHELSFLAFLCGIWMLGGFHPEETGAEERGIVLGVFNK